MRAMRAMRQTMRQAMTASRALIVRDLVHHLLQQLVEHASILSASILAQRAHVALLRASRGADRRPP